MVARAFKLLLLCWMLTGSSAAIAEDQTNAATSTAVSADKVSVAAAANLRLVLPEIEKAFEAESGKQVEVSFGASGALTTQIENGAPFDVFLSADEAFVEKLNAAGLTKDAGRNYAIGRLALYVPEGGAIKADADLAGLKAALAGKSMKKFAIANPETAPYGKAARAALQAAGLWADIEPHLVIGESIAQTLQFATEGGADAALVSESLVRTPEFKGKGSHAIISDALAKPLPQRLVVLKKGGEAADAFAAFLFTEKARALFDKYGYSPPATP